MTTQCNILKRCEVEGRRYVFQARARKAGRLACEGCAAFDGITLEMMPLCDQLPECEGGIWVASQKRKGSPIIPIRIPADLLDRVDARVERSKTHCKIPFNRSTFILTAIAEKLAHYSRASRRGCNTPAVSEQDERNTPAAVEGEQ